MCCQKLIVIFLALLYFNFVAGEGTPKFRILAPQFICPKDEEAVLDKPDNTVITLQMATDEDLRIEWKIRWILLEKTTQRFTLMLWSTVRELEKKLNRPQPEPYVYIIDNKELLRGVNYLFNVTSVDTNGDADVPQSFNIDNIMGDNKLMIEGRNDMLSVILVGGQIAHADGTFAVEAQVTTCYPTQDYYFAWTVQSTTTHDFIDTSNIQSSRLDILQHSVRAGMTYNINCKVMRYTSGDLITQTSLPLMVLHQGFKAHLNVDRLVVSANYTFTIAAIVFSHDYFNTPITYQWRCIRNDYEQNYIENLNSSVLNFPIGLPEIGEYIITLTVTILDQSAITNATVVVVTATLPVIEITPTQRILNEGSQLRLLANASNVAPACTLSWYFATEKYLASLNDNDTCDDCQHGELLTDSITIFSLEEQFLSELADYTNDTEWRQVSAIVSAEAGRARFVAQCGCSLTFNCDTLGIVYADIWFDLNESPKVGEVMPAMTPITKSRDKPFDPLLRLLLMDILPSVVPGTFYESWYRRRYYSTLPISPERGTALETVYRISTLPASDTNGPLTYSFYCRVDLSEDLLLMSYNEYRAVDTFLPFIEDGTEVWVKVCDALGACNYSDISFVRQLPGEARTLDTLMEDTRAHTRRCELIKLQNLAVSAVVTYNNTGQQEAFSKFTETLEEYLRSVDEECIIRQPQLYVDMISQLSRLGIDMLGVNQ